MKKLHISFLQRIDNAEFRINYFRILKYMETREFEDPTFTVLLKRLQSHKDDVRSLLDIIERYNETDKIRELTRLRTDYFLSLRLEIKAKMLSYIPEVRVVAKRLYLWLINFKKRPYIQTIISQQIVVNGILYDRKNKTSIREDITFLNLDGLIDAIEEITIQILKKSTLREKEKMSRLKKGKDKREGAYNEIKALANFIESQLNLVDGDKKESEYYQVLLDLHPKLKDSHTIFKSRMTRNKNKKIKAVQKQILISEQSDEQLTTCQQDPATRPLPMVLTEAWKNVDSYQINAKTNETPSQPKLKIPEMQAKQQKTT